MVGLVVLLAACTPETQKKARKAYGVVTFVKGKVTINDVKARIGSKVTQNDTIVSGANSTAVVQFQKNALMVIKAKTTVNLQAIAKKNNKTALNVIQQKGSTFHKIIKGKADYSVTTPTAVAGVRGTSFNVYVTKKKSKISLLHGRVEVANKKGQKVTLVDKHTTTVTKKQVIKKPKPISKLSQKKMAALDTVKFAEIKEEKEDEAATDEATDETTDEATVDNTNIDNSALEKQVKQNIIVAPIEVPKSVEKFMTIKEKEESLDSLVAIKKKFKKLYMIRTHSGPTYVGAIKEKGDKYEIITTKGKQVISKKDFKSKSPLPKLFDK